MEASVRKPDFFIVGAPKCGTTAMQDYLSQHPEIFMPEAKPPLYRGKELHFFGSDLKFNRPRITQKRYLSYFQGVTTQKRVGEASTWYLYSKRAACEISEFNPTASIIVMLRNPVDMIYSLHSQAVYNGDEDIDDFESALRAEPARKRGLSLPKRRLVPIERFFYREVGRYREQVKRYFDVFGRKEVHIIIFDDFLTDINRVYREALRFLDVDEDFQPYFSVINPNKKVRSKSLRDLLRHPPLIAIWFGTHFIPSGVRQRFIEMLKGYNTKYELLEPMNPELKKQLHEEFAPEVEKLGELLGRDLTHWSS